MNAVLLLLLLGQAATPATAPPIAAAPVGDPVLAEQRGGFRLPNGIDVALTVQTQTSLNGAVLLRTVFQVDQGAPNLTIYAPRFGEVVASGSPSGSEAQATRSTGPTITYDRSTGLQITPGVAGPIMSVTAKGVDAQALPAGLTEVASGAVTDAGTISETARDGVRTVSLNGSDLSVTHLTGNAFGSAIANSGSDRAIDTETTLSVSLANAGPDVLGSAMFRVQDIAIDAATARAN